LTACIDTENKTKRKQSTKRSHIGKGERESEREKDVLDFLEKKE
jgi:hypothetical protein